MSEPKNNKELMAKYFVERNGTEYLSDLMTRSFIEGYDSNHEVILELVKHCLSLKDITEAVIWYRSHNKELEGVPLKMDKNLIISFLIQSKVKQEIDVQAQTSKKPEPEIVADDIFSKFITFIKSIKSR